MIVFIDGAEGTTGLQLEERLLKYPGVKLVKPPSELRKDLKTRVEYLNNADVAFFCLPDDAAKEAAGLVKNPSTVIIDASTAHRTANNWAYGFPELSTGHYNAIKSSNRIAVPGCHASGFCAIVYPLVAKDIVSPNETLFCSSLTGYSGGGKKMIKDYDEAPQKKAAHMYALGLKHKHIPEMTHICGLKNPPVFVPSVVNIKQGMIVTVPILKNAQYIWEILTNHYEGAQNVKVMPFMQSETIDIEGAAGKDYMEIFVFGGEKQAVISARFDNLGKGASGAAVQCMSIRKGL